LSAQDEKEGSCGWHIHCWKEVKPAAQVGKETLDIQENDSSESLHTGKNSNRLLDQIQ